MEAKIYCVIFSFFILYITICLSEPNYCSQDYEVIGELEPDDCPNNTYYEKSKNTNCLARCTEKQGLTQPCNKKKCAPGLLCDKRKCQLNEDSCSKFKFSDPNNTRIWTPECLKDETYALVQCKGSGSNARCFCFDAYGKRIFGEEWKVDAKDMTCACSRQRSELERAGRINVTLHCDSRGNYEPLQCDSDLCWCAEPRTGDVLSSVVPQSMMEFLPCYKSSEIGEQYLRVCESQTYAQAKIHEELQLRGVNKKAPNSVLCGWDGGYGRYKLMSNNILVCINRDGSNTGTWQAEFVSTESYNCNCARDSILFKNAGMELNLLCEGSGNYKKAQGSNGQFYCVDIDGYRTTEYSEVEFDPKDCPKE